MILRRLYLYLVGMASLALLTAGLANLGNTIALFVFNDPQADYSRNSLAGWTATVIVALPVWAIHFWFAQRFARREPADRASAIRRLYVYFACLGSSIGAAVAVGFAIAHLLNPIIDVCPPLVGGGTDYIAGCTGKFQWVFIAQGAWTGIVLLAVWAFHFRIATGDRAVAGEHGASATLRRWYMYIALLVGLLMMLTGISTAIELVWLQAVDKSLLQYRFLSDAVGTGIGGAALWGFHAWILSTRYIDDDRKSTLRALEGFIAVSISISLALFGASQVLYYLLARGLGVNNPGGISNNVIALLAAPVCGFVAYGTAWYLVRRRLAQDAGGQEAERQAGIRRLYTNLAALVSLAAMATGAGGVLWTLAEQVEAPIIGVPTPDWKNPLSQYLTLLVVGAGVWLAHWRHAPWAAERQSLSRRLYVWGALLGSVLAVLGYGIFLLYAVLNQVFQPHPRLDDPSNLDFGHYLAAVVVALAVGFYHFRVLRADSAARPAKVDAAPAAQVGAPAPAPKEPEAAAAGTQSKRYVLTVTDATEDDLHQALAALPPQAGYHLVPTPEDQ